MSQTDAVGDFGATEPRRTHKLTPLVVGARFLPFALFGGVVAMGRNAPGDGLVKVLAITVGVVLLLTVLTAGLAYVGWRRCTFCRRRPR